MMSDHDERTNIYSAWRDRLMYVKLSIKVRKTSWHASPQIRVMAHFLIVTT
jgi:hypothetical protein